MSDFEQDWQLPLAQAVCDNCDWVYLVSQASDPSKHSVTCPHCFVATLSPLQQDDHTPPPLPPELVVPFSAETKAIVANITQFAKSFRFSPKDLNAVNLSARLKRVYLPMYLIDATVDAEWQAEMGFNYQTVSHVERLTESQWQTHEQRETRTRWEPRVGTIQKRYDNVRAAALEEHDELITPMGKYRLWDPEPYDSELIDGAMIRLGNRDSADAWEDALPTFLELAEKSCLKAATGQQIRQFKWHPTFTDQNWTKLLIPVYTSYYRNDKDDPIPVIINGRNAAVLGDKVSSLDTAWRWSALLGMLSIALFILMLVLLFTSTGAATGLLTFVAVIVGLSALYPLIYVSQRQNK